MTQETSRPKVSRAQSPSMSYKEVVFYFYDAHGTSSKGMAPTTGRWYGRSLTGRPKLLPPVAASIPATAKRGLSAAEGAFPLWHPQRQADNLQANRLRNVRCSGLDRRASWGSSSADPSEDEHDSIETWCCNYLALRTC